MIYNEKKDLQSHLLKGSRRGIGHDLSFNGLWGGSRRDRKSTRLNSSHSQISYAVFCLKKKHHVRHSRSNRYLPPLLHRIYGIKDGLEPALKSVESPAAPTRHLTVCPYQPVITGHTRSR